FEPSLEMREIVEILAMAGMRHDPWIGRDIGDREVAGDEGAVAQTLVHDAIESVRLIGVAGNGIGHLFRRIEIEMAVLPGNWPEIAALPEQPLQHLDAAPYVARNEATGLLREIEQDCTRLEDGDRRSPLGRRMIDDCRDAVVGRNGQK